MSYFKLLGLRTEPFSTSPDPAFFFLSREHKAAFCRVQIAITLRRGLTVILGDVGTGKTTLSRKLAQALNSERNVRLHMILNPYFKSEEQFLIRLAKQFRVELPPQPTTLDCMEAIERFLFKTGVEEQQTIVLLIDEAQILPDFVLETLRVLLNYETNEYKILQLVLLAQLELLPRISRMPNFWDRIALKYVINPLGRDEVKALIDYRLRQAGYSRRKPLFTDEAVDLVWQYTQGYPRKLSLICHNCLENLVMYDKKRVDAKLLGRLIDADLKPVLTEPGQAGSGALAGVPAGKMVEAR